MILYKYGPNFPCRNAHLSAVEAEWNLITGLTTRLWIGY